ncbi:glycoside hydrolase family 43 protein [Sphingobacterium deserti]|uniref:Glycoside hydrolase family 43 n=1 Tax=Sphingobacterium deserti TaxID=1229276 RepID=A0A0B8T371_9SPHI|nr:glycoside hydrolase family 43 protein [Sphingobacterium deserti]KGE15937.1 glycoside hydrolase family 43 [Sphingobacterium deserti]
MSLSRKLSLLKIGTLKSFRSATFGCVLLLVSCGSSQKLNQVSSLPLADPFILTHENRYFAYGTSSDRGFEVYHSDNLQRWTKHTQLLLNKDDSYGNKWFWAPEVYYNTRTSRFYLFYSAEEHICVATADSPLGPFRQTDRKPMSLEKGIDSSLFIDEDGKAYLYFVRFTDGNVIWVAELEDDWQTIKEETLTKCIDASTQEWEQALGKVAEGASVIKRDGMYYLIYSGNDFRSPDYGVGFATARSPKGPWVKDMNNPILQRPEKGLVGTGHGAYFEDKKGKLKYVFHAHQDSTKVNPRLLYIVDMEIKNGKVKMDKGTIIRPQVVEVHAKGTNGR